MKNISRRNNISYKVKIVFRFLNIILTLLEEYSSLTWEFTL